MGRDGPVLVLGLGFTSNGGIERVSRDILDTADIAGRLLGSVSMYGEAYPGTGRYQVCLSADLGTSPKLSKLRYLVAAVCVATRMMIRARRPGVVVVCHVELVPIGLLLRMSGWRVHVLSHGYEMWRPMPRLLAIGLRSADSILHVSDYTQCRFERANPTLARQGRRLRLATDTERFRPFAGAEVNMRKGPVRGEKLRVATVARLTTDNAYKGVDKLLESFRIIVARLPNVALVVVGDGDDRGRLEGVARRLAIWQSVVFVGACTEDELVGLLQASDIFALPGRLRSGRFPGGEGFGLVFIEAAACGLPTIAGRGGGSSEAIIDGVTGYLVDGNNELEIASRIVDLCTDEGIRERMARAGRAWVEERHSITQFREQIRTHILA